MGKYQLPFFSSSNSIVLLNDYKPYEEPFFNNYKIHIFSPKWMSWYSVLSCAFNQISHQLYFYRIIKIRCMASKSQTPFQPRLIWQTSFKIQMFIFFIGAERDIWYEFCKYLYIRTPYKFKLSLSLYFSNIFL